MRLYSAVLFLVLSCFSCNKKVLTSTDSDHKKAGEQQGSYSKLSDNQLLDLVQKQTIARKQPKTRSLNKIWIILSYSINYKFEWQR